MWYECGECGHRLMRERPPAVCSECGWPGSSFVMVSRRVEAELEEASPRGAWLRAGFESGMFRPEAA
jgi:hypothetical protein